VPWNTEKLAYPPDSGALGFYPTSQFSIFKNVIRSNDSLKFPEFLWVSKNHYNLQWTMSRTLRRLKNVIVVMEYQPSIREPEPTVGASVIGSVTKMLGSVGLAGGQFTLEQENILLRCFSMFDTDDDGKLTTHDIKHVSCLSLHIHDLISQCCRYKVESVALRLNHADCSSLDV
jgi:hypothetical protein